MYPVRKFSLKACRLYMSMQMMECEREGTYTSDEDVRRI